MRNRILQNDEGIAPVLGFILMLATGITILTTVQLIFVPVWNAQEELDHLKLMKDDFKVLNSNIEVGILGGTTLSSPLSMGFKYSPKTLVYNPREGAFASLEVRNDTFVEVRYNEVFPDGTMDDNTSIKNVSTCMMIYALQGAQKYNSFIYENGLIRRSGSNYTEGSQRILANNTTFLPGVKSLEYRTLSGIEKQTVNIYPTSQQKNSVIGKNVWLILHTNPDYVDWWAKSLEKEGAKVNKINDTVFAYVNTSIAIRMGETYLSAWTGTSPARLPAVRLVRVSEYSALPVGVPIIITLEAQDKYNNPVPNVPVSFRLNTTRPPSNSGATATLKPDSVTSGADGRASVTLDTKDAGFYYIDANLPDYSTTFVYSASSQGYVLLLDHEASGADYLVTATLKDSYGKLKNGSTIAFNKSDGVVNPVTNVTANGTASTTLNVSSANGTKITNIQIKNTTTTAANITWDTVNNITVTAKTGYVFNYRDVPIPVITTGCVFYGTSPGNYGKTNCDTSAASSSHLVSLKNLLQNTPYYFIVNSSPPGGLSVNSTEYMFVTQGTGDYTPPASITNLTNVTGSLVIRWTWDDPEDADFDYVEIMIDDVIVPPPEGIVTKGIKSFNATFLMPNSTHNISIRTVDTSGNANETWVPQNASTRSLLTYVFNFTISSERGNVTNWSYAQNGTDGGASALFDKRQNWSRHNYTNVTRNITTIGNISNWANMKNDSDGGDYANFTDGETQSSTKFRWGFNTTVESWAHAWTGTGGTYTTTGGWQTGDGVPAGSVFSQMTGTGKSDTRTSTWTSPSFLWTGGTPATATFNVSFKVQTYTNAATGTYYVVLVKPDATTSEIYPPTDYSATSPWDYQLNNSITPSDFIQSGNYQLQLVSTLVSGQSGSNSLTRTIQVRWDNPNITLDTTTYGMNITTYTDPVPVNDIYYLEINYSLDSNDTYNVYIWNGSKWNNRISLDATPGTWNVTNYILKPGENNSGNVTIRYLSQNSSGTSPGNLSIDYQRIHGYTTGTPGNYYLNVTTNTTGIPYAASQVLQVRYNVSVNEDNFTLQVYNKTTSGWDNKSTLNQTALTLLNITLQSNYLLPDGYYSPGNVNDLSRYYMLVRYLGINASKPGKLYLDYQRVNSS